MTFFEQELRKIVGAVYPDAKYIGRAAYVDLGGDNRAKLEFVTLGHADHYEAVRASIINRNDGVVDSVTLRFSEQFSPRELPFGRALHAWTCDGKTEWYGFTPTQSDYAAMSRSAGDYLSVFQDMRQEQAPTMQSPFM